MAFLPIDQNNGEQNLKHRLCAEYLLLKSTCHFNELLLRQGTSALLKVSWGQECYRAARD